MRAKFLVLGGVIMLLLGACQLTDNSVPTLATPAQTPAQVAAVSRAVEWLVDTHQNDDGGYTSFSVGANLAPSDAAGTLDAILALTAAGHDVGTALPGQPTSPLTYLQENADALAVTAADDSGQAGKLLLALAGSGSNARAFGGHDFVADLAARLRADGSYNVDDPYKQSLAILGLIAAGADTSPEAIEWLVTRQAPNGSWDDGFGTSDNADATAVAVMAMVAAGERESTTVVRAVDFLRSSQREDGGWAYGADSPTSANSTALVIQALTALGEDWQSASGDWVNNEVTPLSALLNLQGDSGAFQTDFGDGPLDDFFATVQALPAIAGQPLPLRPTTVADNG